MKTKSSWLLSTLHVCIHFLKIKDKKIDRHNVFVLRTKKTSFLEAMSKMDTCTSHRFSTGLYPSYNGHLISGSTSFFLCEIWMWIYSDNQHKRSPSFSISLLSKMFSEKNGWRCFVVSSTQQTFECHDFLHQSVVFINVHLFRLLLW